MRGDYYDFEARLMDTDATFRENPTWETSDNPTITDPETGRRWQLDGVHVAELSAADRLAVLCEWGNCEDAVHCSVADNGNIGDGLWLRVSPAARAVREEHDDGPEPLLMLRLTPRQARILGAALTSAARMREAQG